MYTSVPQWYTYTYTYTLYKQRAIPIVIGTPPPPVEEPWNFQGRGVLTLEFPGEGVY